MTPIYTYIDLTPRKDTGTINKSPEITMFPYYQVDSEGDQRITIHGKNSNSFQNTVCVQRIFPGRHEGMESPSRSREKSFP